MSTLAVIVGSAYSFSNFSAKIGAKYQTSFGETSSGILEIEIAGYPVIGIARHGHVDRYAPHAVNYRANIDALRSLGVRVCIGLNIVGGIASELQPGRLAVPHQLIDYTTGRLSTFSEPTSVVHTEFTEPFSEPVRQRLLQACATNKLAEIEGTYGVTQGPRLETAAEIDRLDRDGCAMVGMTAMPEAILAREAGLEYAILAGVVNYAAGRAPGRTADQPSLMAQMTATVEGVMHDSRRVLETAVKSLLSTEL